MYEPIQFANKMIIIAHHVLTWEITLFGFHSIRCVFEWSADSIICQNFDQHKLQNDLGHTHMLIHSHLTRRMTDNVNETNNHKYQWVSKHRHFYTCTNIVECTLNIELLRIWSNENHVQQTPSRYYERRQRDNEKQNTIQWCVGVRADMIALFSAWHKRKNC